MSHRSKQEKLRREILEEARAQSETEQAENAGERSAEKADEMAKADEAASEATAGSSEAAESEKESNAGDRAAETEPLAETKGDQATADREDAASDNPAASGATAAEASEKRFLRLGLRQNIRRAIGLVGLIALATGAIGLFRLMQPSEENVETVISSYVIQADATYKVAYKANELFKEKLQAEGQVYSAALTEYIEVDYLIETASTAPTDIETQYHITVHLEGFQQRGETKLPIYHQIFPIAEKAQSDSGSKAVLEETVRIDPQTYRNYAERADQTLGGTAARELYLMLEGKVLIGDKEESFSHAIVLPVRKESFYELTKGEPVNISGDITEVTSAQVTPSIKARIPWAAGAAAGAILLIFVFFFTKNLRGNELWRADLRSIMKKYGSRMVFVEELPSTEGKPILRLNEINGMVGLAEEMRKPILYTAEEDGLPTDGRLMLVGDEYVYLLELRADTPSVV